MLAGANCMPTTGFVIANLTGALLWVGMDCTAAFFFSKELSKFAAWDEIAIGSVIVVGAAAAAAGWTRYERRLRSCAEQMLPGDLKPPGLALPGEVRQRG